MSQSSRLVFLAATIGVVAIAWPGQSLGKGRSKKGSRDDDGGTAAPPAAPAPLQDRADDLIRQGVELRKSGNDDKALEAFRASYQLRPAARAQAQVGLAEQALGLWVDAEADLKGALREMNDPWISKNAKALSGALATVGQHLGSLQLMGTPAGAVVKIDERQVGKLPFEKAIRVTAGEVLVSVSLEGYIEINRKITVSAGRLVRETIALHAQPRLPPSPVASAGDTRSRPTNNELAAPRPMPASAPEPTTAESTDSPRRFGTAQRWGIGVVALGVVAAGVGGVFVAQAISKNNESKAAGCVGDRCNAPGTQARWQALKAGDRATIALASAGVLVAGGVTLFVLGRHKTEATQSAWWVAPVTDGERVALVGSMRF